MRAALLGGEGAGAGDGVGEGEDESEGIKTSVRVGLREWGSVCGASGLGGPMTVDLRVRSHDAGAHLTSKHLILPFVCPPSQCRSR